jgi:uncharacterized membrane protein YkvA (DUF1232 family)
MAKFDGSGSPEHFSENGFWDKAKGVAKVAGAEVIEKALWLYFVLQKPGVPAKDKAIIVGALGYFILPFDVIPDILVPLGYTDDLGALALAVVNVSGHIDDEVKRQAEAQLVSWGLR